MLKIGLTGGIGSGKTTVSDQFKAIGIPIIDTDIIARELVDNDAEILSEIAGTFGKSIISEGRLDRPRLAQIVFSDEAEKQRLEKILHPRIRQQVKRQVDNIERRASTDSATGNYCIIVIPLLFETGFVDLVDRVLVVSADEQSRIKRISERDHRPLDEIHSIIDAQVGDEIRADNADDIIDNNSDIKTLTNAVYRLHLLYLKLSTGAG